jgi:hypothetical protein
MFVFSRGYSNKSCWCWQDKAFPHLYFSKIVGYFHLLSASSPAICFDFEMSKKSKITKSASCPMSVACCFGGRSASS